MQSGTSARTYLPFADHLRVLAIALVFLFHYRLFDHPRWVDAAGNFGWTGVDLFFVLSGYLISGQIFQQMNSGHFSLKSFFIRRGLRILPAYLSVLAFYFLVPAVREWEHLAPLWKYLSFTQNFGLDLRHQRTFSHAWSLCIEEQFYLLLPFSILLLRRLRNGAQAVCILLSLVVAGILLRHFSWINLVAPHQGQEDFYIAWYKYLYYPTYNRLDGLIAGIGVAAIRQYRPLWKFPIAVALPLGLALLALAYFLCAEQATYAASVAGYPMVAAGYGCLLWGATGYRMIGEKGKLLQVSSAVATLSYPIYLVHKITIHLAQHYFFTTTNREGTGVFWASVALTICAAALLHLIIEKPFLLLRRKILCRMNILQTDVKMM